MICQKCGKSIAWEKLSINKEGENRHYHLQCWDSGEED